ncbi:Hypothetical predicted protein [Mytilus galloprovincialis]|uniref:C-type lectin domain-containing protein n=1 Tax=Mytilus galloprovincialis TaxID=29158 RepID=A0A8B6CHC2_MYTGA|nr:Hypothetical predicted protein [Mytilus galloprovincialis]
MLLLQSTRTFRQILSIQGKSVSNSQHGPKGTRKSHSKEPTLDEDTTNGVEYNFDFINNYEIKSGDQVINVKGNLKHNVSFWKSVLQANDFIVNTIEFGYRIPFNIEPCCIYLPNNKSALKHATFVEKSIDELLTTNCINEVECPPFVVNPLTVSVQSSDTRNQDKADQLEERALQCADSGYEWYPDDNFCFQLYTTPLMSNTEAMYDCSSTGQRLVRVDTERKHELLKDSIQQLSMAFNGFWIDGSDEITKHNWLFADGTPITEFHWGKGEPADIGNEDCLIMGSIVDFDWNNLACSEMRGHICEIV